MDFYELEAFVELSQTLHFANSAKKLNLSPSALSRVIGRLEEEMNTKLFERNNRDVQLTENGKKFIPFAKKCLEEQKDLKYEFSKAGEELHGTLHIYCSVTACYTVMPLLIKKLNENYPGIQISVETGDPALAIESVKNGSAEVAVCAIPDVRSLDLEFIHIFSSPLVFVSSTEGPFTTIEGSPQDIVSSVPLILPKAGVARQRFDYWTKSRNVKPKIAAEAEGNEAVMALAALGMGIGLVPQIVVESGPYKEGFVCHSAGNALGNYDIGFVQKSLISGSENTKKIRLAVTKVLHSLPTV